MTVNCSTSEYTLTLHRDCFILAQNVHWPSIGKSETEQTMCVKSSPTQIVFQIQITPKNVIEIQNTKYVSKVSKIQNTCNRDSMLCACETWVSDKRIRKEDTALEVKCHRKIMRIE